MKTDNMLDAMNAMDPMLIQEAAERNPVKTRRLRPLIVAACLAVLVAIPVGAAVKNFVVQHYEREELPEELQGKYQDGFVIENPYHIPAENFSEELFRYIESLGADIAHEDRYLYFDSMEEAETFIGVNLFDNPVLDEAEPRSTYWVGENSNSSLEHYCRLYLEGKIQENPREGLHGMILDVSYRLNEVYISVDAYINAREGGDTKIFYYNIPMGENADNPDFAPLEERVTASGQEYTITFGKYSKEESWYAKAFLNYNGIAVSVGFSGRDEAVLRETVQQVMDGFQ